MSDDDKVLRFQLIHRIFLLQSVLVVIGCCFVPLAIYFGLGFFWMSFLAGIFGASISLLRRATRDEPIDKFSSQSWTITLSPFLYGGVLAGVAYFLLMSGLLSGEGGDALIRTNLFPNFKTVGTVSEVATMQDFLSMRPATLADAAKLIVWSLLAGYSENFITGVLSNLEQKVNT